jgi:serine/threonine protein kinase
MSFGGNIHAEGLYGCTFIPPLKCKPNTIQSFSSDPENDDMSQQLSKIISKDDADMEFTISKLIHKIPLYKNYFAVSETICEPNRNQVDKNMDHCSLLDQVPLSKTRLLIMPFAGKQLSEFQFDLKHFDFMNFITHLISAGALLNLFGIVHRDLHQGNILVDSHNVPRIIDFNLSIPVRFTDLDVSLISHKYDYKISQEPPDSTLVNAIAHQHNPISVIQSICFKKPIIKKIITILGISSKDMYNSLYQFYNKSKSVKEGDLVKWFKLYYRTIDSWAIGITIIDLIRKMSLWSSFSSILQKHKSKLFPLLRKMCAVSPLERIDCVQALHYLDPNHFIIRKYAKQWLSVVGDFSKPF